jgi:conjugative transfer region protein (TIGR03750 family)
MKSRAPLSDRVNVEPPIVVGLSDSEFVAVAAISFGGLTGLGLLICMWSGVWELMFVFSVILPFIAIWQGAHFMATIKRRRPDGYYRHWVEVRMPRTKKYINHNGYWQIGRGFD